MIVLHDLIRPDQSRMESVMYLQIYTREHQAGSVFDFRYDINICAYMHESFCIKWVDICDWYAKAKAHYETQRDLQYTCPDILGDYIKFTYTCTHSTSWLPQVGHMCCKWSLWHVYM